MNIYGPPGTSKIIDHLIAACDIPQATGYGVPGQTLPHPRDFIVSRDIRPGDILYIDDIRISCCENTHYRPEKQFGQDGPISLSYRFDASDRSMVFTGDTGPCHALEEFAKNADLLVGEIFDTELVTNRLRATNPDMSDHALLQMRQHFEEHHLTPEDLGKLASRAGVKKLVAVHIPFITKSAAEDAKYVKRISSKFSGSISISEDLNKY